MSTVSSSLLPATTIIRQRAQQWDEADVLGCLEKCIRQGDWSAVAGLTDRIGSDRLPETRDELAECILQLKRVLIAARVARANLATSLSRVRAAARFSSSLQVHERHRFAEPTDF
jgi:hypothetical protein